ncbi:hypothetical protein ACFL4P_01375 [Gemmatimonadota bacterium]
MGFLKRRDFFGSLGFGIFGALGSRQAEKCAGTTGGHRVLRLSKTGENTGSGNVTVNVKPVGCYMIHRGVWTGPCRWNPNPPPEEERVIFRNYFEEDMKALRKNLGRGATLLEPLYIEYPEATGFGEEELNRLKDDHEQVDLYYIKGNVYPQHPGSLIGEKYLKPAAMIGGYVNWDLSARLRSKGLEGYAPADFNELNGLIDVLRAKKAFQNTRLLIVSDTPFNNRPAPSACMDLEGLKERFGIEAKIISYQEFSGERDRVGNSVDAMDEIKQHADRLIGKAEKVLIDRKWIVSSLIFYSTVMNLMRKYNTNAFTIECFEFCSSRLSFEWKVVPCLTHSLLKDQGYPSGCEGDMNALLAMGLLMGVSKRSAFMGNLYLRDENRICVHHNVPGLKMMGFDKPDLPYSLQNFITQGWGPKVQMDLSGFEEKTVTIARCDPLATRVLLTKGTVVGSEGFDQLGCSLRAVIEVPEAKGLIKKAHDYGFHFAMVYGDCTEKMFELAEMLNLKIDSHLA